MGKMYAALIVLVAAGLIGCSQSDKSFEHAIDEKLNDIVHPKDMKVSLSSNPYDYIKGEDSNKDYKYIVEQGEKSLNYMLGEFADGNNDGLREYIMAMACAEILQEDPASKDWSSGRGWYNHYKSAENP
ncbi:hypothetical protein M3194_23535 [Paenibacillus glycanilyticus]|uniref:hypothetical protein n=1 Tax=Paenibacillus glycanilyticus TaxID=126569 RepID=UPI00203C8DC6|nr:hypothetical protein [Paenibacillus glycanilyticus]MCM3630308.1 hypothetical protein [Paenibacillus glycanilyticus]